MRKLHLVTADDELRPALNHIQVKGGFVRATNAHILIKSPVKEVFGDVEFAQDEELYFEGKEWKASKMYNAVTIQREGNIFKALDRKRNVIGAIVAKTSEDIAGKFPTVFDDVIPNEETKFKPFRKFGFNADLYFRLAEAFGGAKNEDLYLTCYAHDKAFVMRSADEENNSIGLILPLYLKDLDYQTAK